MIEFESVSKVYRDGTHAVQDLSLTIPSDRITVFVGPSGCGKTTTLRMINRMLEPTSGRITWDGTALRSRRKTTLRRQMGYVIQSGGLFPHRTVLDNIGTVPGLLGWDRSRTRKRSLELLDAVGLDRAMAGRYPAQLSGGQQQRVGVARALAADPLVMLMDEPFSAVDPVVRADLHELFLGLQRELSKTIVLITHDIDEAIKLGDQVAILRVGGRLAQVGTPQQLLDEPADAFVEGFVGRDRGYRALTFAPAGALTLGRVPVVRDPANGTDDGPTLVVDGDARPLGWVDPARPGRTLALGAVFDPGSDTLRAALDSALTSPVGLAVAVDQDTGRYAGVVGAAEVLEQAARERAAVVSGQADRIEIGSAPAGRSAADVEAGEEPSALEGFFSRSERRPPAAEVDTPTEIRTLEGEPEQTSADSAESPAEAVESHAEPTTESHAETAEYHAEPTSESHAETTDSHAETTESHAEPAEADERRG